MATLGLGGNTKSSSKYPEPVTVNPLSTHKHTFILLHGRGSTAQRFAEPFLSYPIPSSGELSESKTSRRWFPHAKFIFPTAPLRRAVFYNRSLTRQWFDHWTLDQMEYREELQIQGLKETSAFVHALLQKEIDIVGPANVVLGGLSQGWAASLIAFLTWQGDPIAGAVGMCGWLPLRKGMEVSTVGDVSSDVDDIFEQTRNSIPPYPELGRLGQALGWLRDELEMSIESTVYNDISIRHIPIFIGHGTADEKVPYDFGKQAYDFLSGLGGHCRWYEYQDLGHWYSPEMLRGIVSFLQSLEGWRDNLSHS